MKVKVIVALLIFGMCSCEGEKGKVYELPANARALISGGKAKTWKLAKRMNNDTRMNMGDCFLSYRLTVNADGTLQDNAGTKPDCGETLNAEWKFAKTKEGDAYLKMKSDQLPELLNIDQDYKLFKLMELSEGLLVLRFQHKQFSNKTTTITDVYVPEGTNVKDRTFHW